MRKAKPLQSKNRYAMREDGTGMWAVYDIFTGLTAEVNGIPQDGQSEVVARFMAKELNDAYVTRRKGITH